MVLFVPNEAAVQIYTSVNRGFQAGMERKFFGLVLLLFIALASHEMMAPVQGRVCESKSHGFKGACMSNHNCALVCRNEGFSGGRCRGFRHRCFCTKFC